MTDRLLALSARRLAPEALFGVAVFAALITMTACQATIAAPHAAQGLTAGLVTGIPGYGWPAPLIVLLCAVLSGLAALNLAFFRHLVRASRPPQSRLTDGPIQHSVRIR